MFPQERYSINFSPLGLYNFFWILLQYILVIVFFDSVAKFLFFASMRSLNINDPSDLLISSGKLAELVTGVIAGAAFTYSLVCKHFPDSSRIKSLTSIGLRTSSISLCVSSAVLGICLAIIFEKYIPSFFPPPVNVESNSSSLLGQSTLTLKPYYLLISVGIGPIAEEFFFRGFLYKALSLSWGKVSAGAVVSIVFVLFHYQAFEYWVALMSLLLGSIVLLVLREKSGSLIPPILMHQFYNFGAGIWA